MFGNTKTIAKKWGVSEARVTILCKQGRISGAIKVNNRWRISEESKKPHDERFSKKVSNVTRFKFIDLFAGIGGFHQAMRYLGGECVMAAEINQECAKTYDCCLDTVASLDVESIIDWIKER